MSEKEYRPSGLAVGAERFGIHPMFYEDGKDIVSSKEHSLYVSALLNRVGYSYEMIKRRQQYFAEMHDTHSRLNLPCIIVTTGGKGEGTSLYCESDVDTMYIINDVICADNPKPFIRRDNITLFQTETKEASLGYTRLRRLRFDGKKFKEQINSSLFEDETGTSFISSQSFTEAIQMSDKQSTLELGCTTGPISGPSTPWSDSYMSYDRVYCFKCVCPSIIKRWMSRHRSHGWPSPETIHKISLLDGHAVPVGSKGSLNMYKEWRICYSLAELHLMRNSNKAQLKVYILLKKMCKSVLNPVCKDLTSYLMKNIIFWVCEENGIDTFTQDSIMDRLFDCIKYLKKCVHDNNLPSYMIPERNLLAGRLDIEQKRKLASSFSDLLKERGRMFLRCEQLRDAMIVMYKTPDMLRQYYDRDTIESMFLKKIKIESDTWIPGMSQDEVKQLLKQNQLHIVITKHIDDLIQLHKQELLLMGKTSQE